MVRSIPIPIPISLYNTPLHLVNHPNPPPRLVPQLNPNLEIPILSPRLTTRAEPVPGKSTGCGCGMGGRHGVSEGFIAWRDKVEGALGQGPGSWV